MNKNSEEISNLFSSFGLEISSGMVEDTKMRMWVQTDGMRDDFRSKMIRQICSKLEFEKETGFEKFALRAGLMEKYRGIPKWLVNEINFSWDKEKESLVLEDAFEIWALSTLEDSIAEEDGYFVEKLNSGKQSEYKLKKMFDIAGAAKMLSEEVIEESKALRLDVFNSEVLALIANEIQNLIKVSYKELASERNKI